MRRFCVHIILTAFLISILGPLPAANADELILPKPGTMVHLSPAFNPPALKGIKVHPDNPLRFDFILDKGDSKATSDQLKHESNKLIKYFLASLTIPEKDLWVNLSPYEKDRIVPEAFGQTEMGRDLLAQDYMLKQITASLIYPEDEIGRKFWKRVYEESTRRFGNTRVPVNTFNKVWIVPERAVVFENAKSGAAYVVESKLKVMLEQDYLSLQKNKSAISRQNQTTNDTAALGSSIVREIVIPQLEKEINGGRNFSGLRQVYNSLILATWYKRRIKDGMFESLYIDRNMISGVNISDPQEKGRIYEQYLRAFKEGAYNIIKEEQDPLTKQVIPRKYFSGGFWGTGIDNAMTVTVNPRMLTAGLTAGAMLITAGIDVIQNKVTTIDRVSLASMVTAGIALGVGGYLGMTSRGFFKNRRYLSLFAAIFMAVGGTSGLILNHADHFLFDPFAFSSMFPDYAKEADPAAQKWFTKNYEFKMATRSNQQELISQSYSDFYELLHALPHDIDKFNSGAQGAEAEEVLNSKFYALFDYANYLINHIRTAPPDAVITNNLFAAIKAYLSNNTFGGLSKIIQRDDLQLRYILAAQILMFEQNERIADTPGKDYPLGVPVKLVVASYIDAYLEWQKDQIKNPQDETFPFLNSFRIISQEMLRLAQAFQYRQSDIDQPGDKLFDRFEKSFPDFYRNWNDLRVAESEDTHLIPYQHVKAIMEIRRLPSEYRKFIHESAKRHSIPEYLVVNAIIRKAYDQEDFDLTSGLTYLKTRGGISETTEEFIKKYMPEPASKWHLGPKYSTFLGAMFNGKTRIGMTGMRPVWVRRADGFRSFGIDANTLSNQRISWLLLDPQYAIEATAAVLREQINWVEKVRQAALEGVILDSKFMEGEIKDWRATDIDDMHESRLLPDPKKLGSYEWIELAFHPLFDWSTKANRYTPWTDPKTLPFQTNSAVLPYYGLIVRSGVMDNRPAVITQATEQELRGMLTDPSLDGYLKDAARRALRVETINHPGDGAMAAGLTETAGVIKNSPVGESNTGGIDFNSDRLNLQMQNSGQSIVFHVDSAMLKRLKNATGFTPTIINIQPMQDLRLFLGLEHDKQPVSRVV